MAQQLKQAEKEIESRNIEINHYKQMCTEVAEKLDKEIKKNAGKDKELLQRDQEVRKVQDRLGEYEVRIGQLNLEKSSYAENVKAHSDKSKDKDREIGKRDHQVQQLNKDIQTLHEDLRSKDEIIESLQNTIFKKGTQNQRLAEVVNTFKNQLIMDQIFQQTFAATYVGTLKSLQYQSVVTFKFLQQKTDEAEFWLEIQQGDAHSTQKNVRIAIADIEAIEPVQATRFELRYLKAQSYFSRQKTLKVEVYDSKYLAEILDCYEQVSKMVDEAEKRLENFIDG